MFRPTLCAEPSAPVNNILCDILNRFVFVYLDDVLIFSRSQEESFNMSNWYFRVSWKTSSPLEWRYWPEGAAHPFLMWTDHLKPHLSCGQAADLPPGSLFFVYQLPQHPHLPPQLQEHQSNVLSCQLTLSKGETSEEPIIFLKSVATAARWEIEHSIKVVQHSQPSPLST